VRNSTRWLGAILAAGLAVTGCSGKEGDDTATAVGGGEEQDDWSAGTDTVKVGLIAPLTGPLAVLGASQQNSLQVEIDKVNAAGGLGGAQLALVPRDSGLDPAKAVAAAQELAADGQVGLIVGPSITGFWNAAKGTFESQQKVNCQPAVAGGEFGDQQFAFRSQDPAAVTAEVIVSHLKDSGVGSVGLIYEGDDTGKAYDELLKQYTQEQGLEYLGAQFTRADDQSHAPYIGPLSQAEAIVFSNNVGGIKTLAAAAEAGYGGRLISGSGAQNINFLEGAGAAAEGVTFVAPYYPFPTQVPQEEWKPGYREHISAVVEEYGVNTGPNSGAESPKGTAIAADCIAAFVAAANDAQSIEPEPVAAAWEALDIPDTETPSGNSIEGLAESHEMYNANDLHVYQWKKGPDGFYTEEIGAGT
jgi:ABC-type branched-subunit amino acid transport system substrate-binding protein